MLFGRSIFHPLNLILLFNLFVFLLQSIYPEFFMIQFSLIPGAFILGKYWQIFTYGFLHNVSVIPLHLLMNMYAFYMIGSLIIDIIGKIKFVMVYFLAQLSGGLFILFFAFSEYILYRKGLLGESIAENSLFLIEIPTIGSSGAVFGLLAIFGLLYPRKSIFLLFFPIQAKDAVWIALMIGYILELAFNVPLSNSCHLGGAIMGYFLFFFWIIKDKYIFTKFFQKNFEIVNKNKPKTIVELQEKQKIENLELLEKTSLLKTKNEKIEKLSYLQVPNANICEINCYNSKDEFCLKCEWLVNCEMRQIKKENKS